jgi:DnaJ-class molecular chaperone
MDSHYYHKLGLSPQASLNQIKSTYRTLAKKYHPDVSKIPDARTKFIEISEAYHYLTNKLTGKGTYVKQRKQEYERQKQAVYEDWLRKKQQEARERARQYADLSYEEFTNSEIFKKAVVFFSKKILGFIISMIVMILIILLVSIFSIELAVVLLFLSLPIVALVTSYIEHKR